MTDVEQDGWRGVDDMAAPTAEDPSDVYDSVEAFVTEYFAQILPRRLNGQVGWCAQWHRHPEAVARLIALWRAWEELQRTDGVGLSQWWVYHCDPHARALFDPVLGPFSQCISEQGHTDKLQPLPTTRITVCERTPPWPSNGSNSTIPASTRSNSREPS